MNFYKSTHQHYCGIDLHARSLYVCIINQQGETLLHKEIPAKPDALIKFASYAGLSNAKPNPPAKPMARKATKSAMPTSNGPSLKRRFYTSEATRALNNYCNAFKCA